MAVCHYEERLPASFKGVGFRCVLKGGREGGRRGAEGEFPFGEITAYADMGRKIRVFTLTARFSGPSYIEETHALVAACESPGPGSLVHPTAGLWTVGCRKCDVTENYEESDGVAEVELDFVEAQSGSLALVSRGGVSIDAPVSRLKSYIAARWNPAAAPFYALPSLTDTAADALAAFSAAIAAAAGHAPGRAVITQISNLDIAGSGDRTALKDGPVFAELIGEAAATLDATATTPQAQFSALVTLSNWASRSSVQPTTSAFEAEESLFAAIRALCAAYMARAAQEMGVTTMDAALRRIAQIETILHEEIARAISVCDDALHLLLRQLEAGTVPQLYAAAYQSPPIVAYRLNGGVPSLVAAHEVYGDARKFAQVERMNPFAWPWAIGPRVFATRETTGSIQ